MKHQLNDCSDRLERANAELAARDLMVMQQDNGRYAIYRIERGAIAMHGTAYDRYVRVPGKSHATLEQAQAAAALAATR